MFELLCVMATGHLIGSSYRVTGLDVDPTGTFLNGI